MRIFFIFVCSSVNVKLIIKGSTKRFVIINALNKLRTQNLIRNFSHNCLSYFVIFIYVNYQTNPFLSKRYQEQSLTTFDLNY